MEIYELAPGGAPTVDPAVAYYTVDDEPISNVYETLISFNGSDTGPLPDNWVPEIATCVPGSAACSAQTGSSLVFDNTTTGQPQYYTFEISAGANFYDPSTGVSWPVYPSDVLFSFIRTLMFANLPAVGYNNGWIQAQYLLPTGSTSYDSGIHYPYNNTPAPVFDSILVNDSAYCPASSLPTNGCVTFNVGASGEAWPYFLEMVSDPLGGSITPCGVFTYLQAGVPGFLGSKAKDGDGPCLLPGNATSSTQSSFKNWVATASPELWDEIQELELTAPPSPQPGVQYTMVGSGPYYAVSVSASGGPGGSGGYTLKADPTYEAPEGCAGQPNCLPEAGDYIPNVVVYWDNDDTLGLQEAIAGQADSFGYDESHTSTVLDLVHSGTYGLLQNVLTGNNWNMMFTLTYNLTNEQAWDSTGLTNIPSDFLANQGLREFLVHAYPYTTIENTIWTVDNVSYAENYGGAIPPGQTLYYPDNVSWPYLDGNPATNPAIAGGAASWWQNISTPTSAWYDPELAACTPSSPCQFAIQGWIGAPSLDDAMSAWIASIKTITGGDIVPYYVDISGSELYSQVGLGNGNGSLPVYNWGWVPDYNDPTDYMVPFWLPNGTFSYAQGLYSTFAEPRFNSPSCGHTGVTFANLTYWANYASGATTNTIPDDCQGVAYSQLVAWNAIAAHNTSVPDRILQYNLIEHIGNLLNFEVYSYTTLLAVDYGSWLSPTGINLNPSVGGGGVQTWYTWTYANAVYQVSLQASGLAAGKNFSATLDGTTNYAISTGGTTYVNFTGLANGTYPWTVNFIAGYTASPANGTALVSGANVTSTVTFAAFVGVTNTVTFTESGLVSNTTWSILVVNVGALSSNYPSISLTLNASLHNWSYVPGVVIGYTHAASGSFAFDALSAVSISLVYSGIILTTYAVEFSESGLPPSTSWSVDLGGFTLTSTAENITFYEENGTYRFSLGAVTGYTPPASAGQVAVVGANVVVAVPFSAPGQGFDLSFIESGLPTGSPWNITVNGFGIQSLTTTITFVVPNGTYPWSVSTIGGWTTDTWSGVVVVNGTTPPTHIAFVPFTYAVTFFEGGLATGATWSVIVDSQTYTSDVYYLVVPLPNGTFAFTVPTIAGFVSTPASGNVTVDAAPATQVIIYGPIPETFTVTFTASGLPTGATWTVFFAGHSYTGTGTSTSWAVTNGTWTYAVLSPTGYTVAPSGGSITVNGANITQTVTFTAVTSTTSTTGISATLFYGLVGLFVVLTVVFLALALYWRGRKPPAAAPPQSWESGSTSSTTEPTEGSPPPSS